MSGYSGQPLGMSFPQAPSSFMPPSTSEYTVHPQMLPDSNRYKPQYASGPFPANVMQLPHTVSQDRQKRDFSGLHNANDAMFVPQHRDPTFFGLSSSLPMSTYSTHLSPPPQIPRKKHRQSNQDIQGGSVAPQRLPQTNASHVHQSVPSARLQPVYSKHSMPSRRRAGPTERDRRRHLPQKSTSNVSRQFAAFANPYVSDPPPSWNWINEQHAVRGAMNTSGTFNSNFRFHWPILDDQLHYNQHLQSMQQNPMQMPHTLVQPDFMIPPANTGMLHFTPEQLRGSEVSQAVPEIRNYTLEGIGVQMDHVCHSHDFLVQQGIKILVHGQGKTPLPHGRINSDDIDTWSTSRAKIDSTDVAHLHAIDASVLEEIAGFDGEFNFNFEALSNTAGNSSEVIDAKVEAQDSNDTADASEECEFARLLAPVAEYLSFKANDHSEKGAEEVVSDGIPKSDGTGLGSTHDVIPQSNRNDSLPFLASLQSPSDLDVHFENDTNDLPNERVSINRLDQSYARRESLLECYTFHEELNKGSSLSTTPVASNGNSASGQATASTQTSMLSSPADLGRATSSWPTVRTASHKILSRTPAIDSSTSENSRTTFQGTRLANGKNAEEVTERVQSVAGTEYDRLGEKTDNVRSDMTDWVNDRFPAVVHQPIANKFKMPLRSPRVSSRVGIYGRQVLLGSGCSPLGEGQEITMAPPEKDKLWTLQERAAQPQELQHPGDQTLRNYMKG